MVVDARAPYASEGSVSSGPRRTSPLRWQWTIYWTVFISDDAFSWEQMLCNTDRPTAFIQLGQQGT